MHIRFKFACQMIYLCPFLVYHSSENWGQQRKLFDTRIVRSSTERLWTLHRLANPKKAQTEHTNENQKLRQARKQFEQTSTFMCAIDRRHTMNIYLILDSIAMSIIATECVRDFPIAFTAITIVVDFNPSMLRYQHSPNRVRKIKKNGQKNVRRNRNKITWESENAKFNWFSHIRTVCRQGHIHPHKVELEYFRACC